MLVLLFIVVAVIIGVSVLTNALNNEEELTYGDVKWYLENDLVKSFVVDGNQVLHLQLYKPVLDKNGLPQLNPEGGKYIIEYEKYYRIPT